MARLRPRSTNKKGSDKILWSAEFEHNELDTSNRRMVKSRSYTPWVADRADIVDFVANREGIIKKVYQRDGGEIQVATAQGGKKLRDVLLPIDEDELNDSYPGARSAEDLTLG